MSSAMIIAAKRTPLGKFLGSLATQSATQLGAVALCSAREQSGIPAEQFDEVILGQVITSGAGQAPARQAALGSGLPATVPASTVNKVCGSGLFAVMLAERAIRAGAATAILAGGMESMSQAPHLLRGARSGWKYGTQPLLDSVEYDGLRCAIGDTSMGCYADQLANKQGISRQDQDAWALSSHQRAVRAQTAGDFANELTALTVTLGKQSVTVDRDESPRADSSLEQLAKLRPAFDPSGTATAGNSSPLSDGAAALVVVHESLSNTTPWAFRIVSQAVAAGLPSELFTAPIAACQLVLQRAGWQLKQVDQWEINEAFASQTLACERGLGIDPARLNAQGGAIALGHPIGASGARVLVTLLNNLLRQGQSRGVAALCLGGGEAVAVAVERVS